VRLTEHGQRVSCLALAPDGRTLATGAGDGAIIVWDLAGKHQVLQRLDAQKEVAALAFSPDGRTLASAGADGRIRFWSDGGRGRQTHTIVASTVRLLSLAYAPDGKRLVAGGADQVLRWWNVETKTEKPEGQLKLDTGWVKVAAFSPDGRTLVCGGGGDGTLHLCEVAGASLKVRQLLTKHTKLVHDLAFAPDGERFVSAGEDGAAVIWDAAAGKVVQAWTDLRYPVCGAAWAPDGRHVVLANTNSAIYVLRLRSPRGT
jgi:WD40 repeat protein